MFDISKGLLRGAGATGVAIAMAAAAAIPASASISASVSLSFRASQCSSTVSGRRQSLNLVCVSLWPRGTVKFCAYKYRHRPATPTTTTTSTRVVRLQPLGWLRLPVRAGLPAAQLEPCCVPRQRLRLHQVLTSNSSCSSSFQVGVSAGPLSASVTPTVCSGYTVSRYYNGASGAGWHAAKVGGVSDMQSTFYQKVPQGTRRSSPSTSTGRPTSTPGMPISIGRRPRAPPSGPRFSDPGRGRAGSRSEGCLDSVEAELVALDVLLTMHDSLKPSARSSRTRVAPSRGAQPMSPT